MAGAYRRARATAKHHLHRAEPLAPYLPCRARRAGKRDAVGLSVHPELIEIGAAVLGESAYEIEAAGAGGPASKEFVWFSPSKGRTQTTTTAAVPSIDGVDDWTLVSDPRLNPGA